MICPLTMKAETAFCDNFIKELDETLIRHQLFSVNNTHTCIGGLT